MNKKMVSTFISTFVVFYMLGCGSSSTQKATLDQPSIIDSNSDEQVAKELGNADSNSDEQVAKELGNADSNSDEQVAKELGNADSNSDEQVAKELSKSN